MQLNCIVVPSSRQLTVYISREFLEGSMAILEKLCNLFPPFRFHVIIRALPFPEIIITGRVLYILRTLMTMIHRGRASLDFRTTCWFVEFPQYGISNCSGSKIVRNRFNFIYIYIYTNIDKRISFPFNLNSLLFVRIDKNYLKRDYIYYDKCLLFIE